MEALYLDTHAVVWLRQKQSEKFSARGLEAIESAALLLISPMVLLELKFLQEIGRVNDDPHSIVGDLDAMIDLRVDDAGFHEAVKKAMLIDWTCDPFDRLIVAHAMTKNHPLLTKDEKILAHFQGAFW